MRVGHDAYSVALQDRTSKRLARNRENGRRAPALVEDLSIRTCRCRCQARLRGRRWFRISALPLLPLTCEGACSGGGGSGLIRGPLLRQPTGPTGTTFIDVLLPALPRANRAITIVATNRTCERLRGEIECQARVPALSQKLCIVYPGCSAYHFSTQLWQNILAHRLLVLLIDVQRILGWRVLHL